MLAAKGSPGTKAKVKRIAAAAAGEQTQKKARKALAADLDTDRARDIALVDQVIELEKKIRDTACDDETKKTALALIARALKSGTAIVPDMDGAL